jgi:hypothetical protein
LPRTADRHCGFVTRDPVVRAMIAGCNPSIRRLRPAFADAFWKRSFMKVF